MARKDTRIDEETGLPVLPEGYFWQVEVVDNGTGLYVQLMKEGTRWKETKPKGFFRKAERELVDDHDRIDYAYVWLNDGYVEEGVTVDDAYVQSKLVVEASKIVRELQEKWDLKDLLGKYSGKYPPKSLLSLKEDSHSA